MSSTQSEDPLRYLLGLVGSLLSGVNRGDIDPTIAARHLEASMLQTPLLEHPGVDSLLDQPLEVLHLPRRARNALNRRSSWELPINTIRDLVSCNAEELLSQTRSIGPVTIEQIETALAERHLRLGMLPKKTPPE